MILEMIVRNINQEEILGNYRMKYFREIDLLIDTESIVCIFFFFKGSGMEVVKTEMHKEA